MSEVVRQISERLVSRGHEVTVATSSNSERAGEMINGVRVKSFDVRGKSAVALLGDTEGYRKYLLDSDADVMVNFAAQQWATDIALQELTRIRAKKVYVPTGFSGLNDPLFASYFNSMGAWMKQYDACVFLSDDYRDINFARKEGVENLAIIPNAAAEDEFVESGDDTLRNRLGIPEKDFLIIHVAGYLSVAKGQIEAVRIFNESGIRNATLLLVCGEFAEGLIGGLKPRKIARALWQLLRGRGLSGFVPSWQIALRQWGGEGRNAEFGRRIMTAALSREDTVAAFKSADLLLFPSWIECSPLVLFEAAAAATPFLVTDVGNAHEIIRWTGGGRLLPGIRRKDREGSVIADIDAGAALLDELWSNPEDRRRMGESARDAWRRNFTWEIIASRYEELYETLHRGEGIQGKFPPPPKVKTDQAD